MNYDKRMHFLEYKKTKMAHKLVCSVCLFHFSSSTASLPFGFAEGSPYLIKSDPQWSEAPAVFHLILKEAKIRLTWALLCFGFTFVTCYYFSEELLFVLVKPFLSIKNTEGPNLSFISTQLTETLNTYITTILLVCCFFSVPSLMYQLWCFFIPSSYVTQRVWFNHTCLFSGLAFFCMLLVSFTYIMPTIWSFLFHLNTTSTNQFCIQLQPKIYDYVLLTVRILFCTTVCSQIPVILKILMESDLISVQQCIQHRRSFFFGSLCIAALITPPDLWSQLAALLPIYVCVELTIFYELVRLHYNLLKFS